MALLPSAGGKSGGRSRALTKGTFVRLMAQKKKRLAAWVSLKHNFLGGKKRKRGLGR